MTRDASQNEIRVVHAGAKSNGLFRNLIFIAVVLFFITISYMADLGTVAEYTIAGFLIFSFMFKIFTGENVFKSIHFHIVRERNWK